MPTLLIRPPVADSPEDRALLRARFGVTGLYVRLDATHDLAEVLATAPDGLAAAIADARELARLGSRLAVAEAEAGLADGAMPVLGLVTSAAGVLGAAAFAGVGRRLSGLALDGPALARDLGLDPSSAPAPLVHARGQVVLAARAAGVPAFAWAPEAAGRDPAVRADAEAAALRDGFAGLVLEAAGPA